MEQSEIRRFVRTHYSPGELLRRREDRISFILNAVQGALHPCGGCRMGGGPEAVVDPQLRVYGLDNIRVADSSVMPSIVSGNLNGPTVMIAERAADMVRSGLA